LLLLALLLLLLLQLFLLLLQLLRGTCVAEMFLAVLRQLRLLDGRVVRLLLRQREAVGVHHEQVVVAGEHDRRAVRRRPRPSRPLRRLVVVVQEVDAAGRHVVLEVQRPGSRRLSAAA